VAPHLAKSTSGLYIPMAVKSTPIQTYETNILAGVSFVLSIRICAMAHIAPPTKKTDK
jgi:hypothetical protein